MRVQQSTDCFVSESVSFVIGNDGLLHDLGVGSRTVAHASPSRAQDDPDDICPVALPNLGQT